MMSQSTEQIRWTIHDLEVLPQSEGTRYEIIDGELFVSRSPHRRHQQVAGQIFQELNLWSKASELGEAIPAPNSQVEDYTTGMTKDLLSKTQQAHTLFYLLTPAHNSVSLAGVVLLLHSNP